MRRFYGLMGFVVSTGPCTDHLLQLSINVIDEIANYSHEQCPLVDFALSMLVSSWRCRRHLFKICIELRTSLIPVRDTLHLPEFLELNDKFGFQTFLSSIQGYLSTMCGSDLTCAAISCLGLQALLDQSPGPVSYMADCIRCFTKLTKKLLQDDHGQSLEAIEIPVESLGYYP